MNTSSKHFKQQSNSFFYINRIATNNIYTPHRRLRKKQNTFQHFIINFLEVLVSSIILILCSPVIIKRLIYCRIVYGKYLLQTTRFTITKNKLVLFQTTNGKKIDFLGILINLTCRKLNLVGSTIVTNKNHCDKHQSIKCNWKPGFISSAIIRQKSGIAHIDKSDSYIEAKQPLTGKIYVKILFQYFLLSIIFSNRKIDTQNNNSSFRIFNIKIWNGTLKESVQWIVERSKNKTKSTVIGFANANNLNITKSNTQLRDHYNKCNRVFADGSGIRLATQIKSIQLKDNINGTDMLPVLCRELEKNGQSMYLFGAEKGIAESVANNLRKKFINLKIAGTHHGYIESEQKNDDLIDQINQSDASVLLIAMGAPLQEIWLEKNLHKLTVPVKMSVGGLFDFYANKVSRAPLWLRELGCEWIWRIIQEPSRMWQRYIIGNPLFLWRVFRETTGSDDKKSTTSIYRMSKRFIDIVASSIALIILSPVLIITGLAIKIDSKGSILYNQTRIGKNGKAFKFWRFRSMVENAHEMKSSLINDNESSDKVLFKIKKDPRITRVGKVIRKYSIDDLPSFWNVLKGEMTLVGPRPALPEEVEKYSNFDKLRLIVKPGITCYWQISGRSELSFKEQINLDRNYIANRTTFVDLKILLLTVPAVISAKGAY